MSTPDMRAVLLACLHRATAPTAAATVAQLDDRQWDALIALAVTQRVGPLLQRTLARTAVAHAVPGRIVDMLRTGHRGTTLHNLRLCAALARLAGDLASTGVPVVVLKGAYLAREIYEDIGLRQMNDLDILVRVEHLERAAAVARAHGFEPTHAYDAAAEIRTSHHLPPFIRGDNLALEIHWSLTPPEDPHPIDPAALWDDAQTFTLGTATVHGLSLDDLLLHLCFHTSFQHQFQFGLRPFCDIAEVLARRGESLDWNIVVRKARQWSGTRGVFLALRLARDMVGAAVPDDVLRELAPSDCTPTVLDAATAQVFSTPLRPAVARLVGPESVTQKLGHLRRRITLRARNSDTAPGRGLSARGLYNSVTRAGTLVRRDGRALARLITGHDAELSNAAERTNRLREWLAR